MKRCLIIAGFMALGVAIELTAAPVGLAVTPVKPATSTVKSVAKSVAPVAAPVKTTTAVTKPAAVAPTKPVVAGNPPAKSTPASAGGLGLTVKAGTLGAGLEATVGVNDYLGFRFGVNMMSAGPSIERDEGTINTDLDWLSYGPLVDLHVFGGGFRVTGGALINKNKFNLKANLNDSVTLDGQAYDLSALSGQVTFSEWAPYLGFGYGNAVGADGRWHFACDFGVMFQGEPKVEASATASDPALQPYVNQALAKEVADIQDDASAFQFYPVISVGVSYRF
ncbi:MAG: hypothetical protein WCS52_06685 [bacterium]